MGGPDPPTPFVSHCQHFPNPPPPFVTHCKHFPNSPSPLCQLCQHLPYTPSLFHISFVNLFIDPFILNKLFFLRKVQYLIKFIDMS